ncbi:MAG: hypothetical protein AAB393_12715 [Bacteroidota bacterium]|mgnify:CR=1 FL=1
MLSAVRIIKRHEPDLRVILPLAAPHLRPQIEESLAEEEMTNDVTIIDRHTYTCLSACELIMLSSGTATVEAALLGVPMVVAYRVRPITFLLARQLVKARFIAMPNILAGERIVPELIQEDVTPERLATEALRILENPLAAAGMRGRLAQVCSSLGSEGVLSRAAAFVLHTTRTVHYVRMTDDQYA